MRKTVYLLSLFAALSVSPEATLRAQTPPPLLAAPAKPVPATEDGPIERDLRALFTRVQARIQAGQDSADQFSDELQAFDALVEKYAAEQADAAAEILVMKAMLYVQVFGQPEQALVIFKKVVADFPRTQVAAQLPPLIAELEPIAAIAAATAVGREFPLFKETAVDGAEVDLAAYRGKVVLITFWASWCGPCLMELPHVKAAYDKHHAAGFEVIGVNLDEDRQRLADFLKTRQLPWPQISDGLVWEGKLPRAYGVRALPATFLLDRDGRIAAKNPRGPELLEKVSKLLAEKTRTAPAR